MDLSMKSKSCIADSESNKVAATSVHPRMILPVQFTSSLVRSSSNFTTSFPLTIHSSTDSPGTGFVEVDLGQVDQDNIAQVAEALSAAASAVRAIIDPPSVTRESSKPIVSVSPNVSKHSLPTLTFCGVSTEETPVPCPTLETKVKNNETFPAKVPKKRLKERTRKPRQVKTLPPKRQKVQDDDTSQPLIIDLPNLDDQSETEVLLNMSTGLSESSTSASNYSPMPIDDTQIKDEKKGGGSLTINERTEEIEDHNATTSVDPCRYTCKECDKQFRSNIGLQRHEVETHFKAVLNCNECVKTFSNASALSDHKKRVHGPRQYACGLCNADFTSESYLRAHAKVHAEKKHICTECHHSFVNKTDLNNHMRVHNGEKPYPCNVCGKKFRHVSGFYTHVRIHTGETPYKCDFCNKMFTNASNFQTHRKIHTREKRFKCEDCGKEFIQQSNFSRHLRIHTKEKPYGCRECDARFTYSTALKRHEQREHDICPFSCPKCDRTFLNQSSLVRHTTGCQMKDCVKVEAQENSSRFL